MIRICCFLVTSYFFLIFYQTNGTNGASLTPPNSACKNTFCDQVSGYPNSEILAALPTADRCEKQNMSNPASSFQQNSRVINLCNTVNKDIQPRVGKNINGKMRYIVQAPEVNQRLTVQVCHNAGRECNHLEGRIRGHRSACKQNYAFRKFTVITENNEIKLDIFEIEAGCICTLYKH